MRKFLLALVILTGTTFSLLAQSTDQGRFSLDLNAGTPIGGASKAFYFSIGGALKYNYALAEQFFVTGSVGYTYLHGKKHDVNTGGKTTVNTAFDVGAIPIKGGLRYYFDESFYFEGQAGAAFFTEGGKGRAFVYAPSLGYTFTGGFEIGLKYESWTKFQYDNFPTKKDNSIGQLNLLLGFAF